jgi:anti-sigma B factor antagonist
VITIKKLEVTKRRKEQVTILDLSGDIRAGIDIVSFRQNLKDLIEEGELDVLVNLAEVRQVDSSGLGEMIAGFKSVERSGGKMKLLNLTARVSELMMITKLLTVFESYDDEDEAVKSFEPASEDREPLSIATAAGSSESAQRDG